MTTRCHLPGCRHSAHVVLFASGTRLCGVDTLPGEIVVFCLQHGGQLYTVMKAWKARKQATAPTWLCDDLKADRLPRVTPDPRGWSRPASPRSGWAGHYERTARPPRRRDVHEASA